MNKIDLETIKNLLCEVFHNSDIPNDINNLKINDLSEWDSLGNFNLLLLAEEWYKVKFTIEEMSTIKSVTQLISAIENYSK